MTSERRLKAITNIIEGQCQDLGLIDNEDKLSLEIGSKHNGISFKLWVISQEEGSKWNQLHFGRFLGMTKREADLSLSAIQQALSAIMYNDKTCGTHIK